MSARPSGEQVALRHGPWSATVVEVGGGLRELAHDGAPVVDGYPAGEMASGGRGQALLPWPNRVAGGRYRFGDRDIQAPISEPATGTAIHGLTRWSSWRVAERAADRCAMALRLHPQPAYPFALDLRLDYALGDGGLLVGLTARNAGEGPLPFGAGFHPYLTPGAPRVDEARLNVSAEFWLPEDERGIPTGERRPARAALPTGDDPIGPAVLDHCLTGLARDADGRARVRLAGPSGPARTLWMDGLFGYVMVFTGDTLAPDRRRRAVAVEPMTCAPDAFNSGEGLIVLPPGETVAGRWGISVDSML
jgi:aldose 1-epimerase